MKRACEVAASASRRRREKGVALVELAVVLPLLTLLLLTIVDLGMVLREYQILQNATREGARYSIHPPNWVDPRNPGASLDAIRARVVEYMAQEGITINSADVTVTQLEPIMVGELALRSSRITVTYNRALLIPAQGILPAGQLALSASTVFENLY